MKKMLDLVITENTRLNQNYYLLKLLPCDSLPLSPMLPGQFVEIKVENSANTFLRRPISINFVDKDRNELWLLIQIVGDGTHKISKLNAGDTINLLLPLGNSFTIPQTSPKGSLLLVGGGVGIAPMLYLGYTLRQKGYSPKFLLGARSREDLLQLDLFSQYGDVYCTTEDGSYGEKGYVTDHSIWNNIQIDTVYTCGPKPMMVAIAKRAVSLNANCEVSLENTMACGFGVCLCCVEDTKQGNICVCTSGPVFNIKDLKWID